MLLIETLALYLQSMVLPNYLLLHPRELSKWHWNSEYNWILQNVGKLFARFVKQSEPFRMTAEFAFTVYEMHNDVKLSLLKNSK